MKKNILKILLVVLAVVSMVAIIWYIPTYQAGKIFTYEIDKEKGEVTITGYKADYDAKVSYNNKETDELSFPKAVEVPDKIMGYPVTTIGENAFEWAYAEKIILPDTVVTVDDNAFFHCERLTEITGTENIVAIGDYAFSGCVLLEEIALPEAKEMGKSIFPGCEKMEKVVIPDTMTYIPETMCMGMDSLTVVEIPESVEYIDTFAFAFCDKLEKIYIPSSVTEISDSAFLEIEAQLTIYGEKGSCAEKYATEAGIGFIESK